MKWLVFSDSHGNIDYMAQAVEKEKPDRVLHLGDMVRDAAKLRERFPSLLMEQVKGNCDGWSSDEPEEKEVFLGQKRVWMLHGHTYQVKYGTGMLISEARARGVDVVVFGHTHNPLCDWDGLWVMNPGTVSGLPQATYGVIELVDGKLTCRVEESKTPNSRGRIKFFGF